ncbi:MAG: RsmB/NOP family class I SAM-dependent RNA methyltransferase, partial [Proteobacteria bacterium]|nr:RsmB/NOP family class I SAM-dependent RNA methyltransferase [Pseudomonadota bacterium]
AEANVPPDLAPMLAASLGGDWVAELAALAEPAPVDLRVNTLKADRDTARAALAALGIASSPTPFAPNGLRLDGRANVSASGAFRDGLVEVQDEGSQLAARMACARPGETVIDGCAGSGGKSLALAAQMGNTGTIAAHDPRPGQSNRARPRIARAGVEIVAWADTVAALPEQADCVLLDVPCSGSGAWRRDPAAKWRTTPQSVAACAATQQEILAAFAPRVQPGGRLVYVTCSLFQQENEAVIESFLGLHGEFRVAPAETIWRAEIGAGFPGPGPFLRLSPRRTGTDGFFVAVLHRAEGP